MGEWEGSEEWGFGVRWIGCDLVQCEDDEESHEGNGIVVCVSEALMVKKARRWNEFWFCNCPTSMSKPTLDQYVTKIIRLQTRSYLGCTYSMNYKSLTHTFVI